MPNYTVLTQVQRGEFLIGPAGSLITIYLPSAASVEDVANARGPQGNPVTLVDTSGSITLSEQEAAPLLALGAISA